MSGLIRKVKQINRQTKRVIAEFESIAEASKITGIHVSNISHAAQNERPTAGGFVWRYSSKIIITEARTGLYCQGCGRESEELFNVCITCVHQIH